MIDLESAYNTNVDFVFSEFHEKFQKDKEIGDLHYIIDLAYKELKRKDIALYGNTKFTINDKINEIENYKRANRNISLNEQLLLATKNDSEEQRDNIIEVVSTVKGWHKIIKFLRDEEDELNAPTETLEPIDKHSKITTTRQVLTMHYLLSKQNGYNDADKTELARFIQFLTGKEKGASEIKNTNIYKSIRNPLGKNKKDNLEDLQYVRNIYEKLGFQTVVETINKDINSI